MVRVVCCVAIAVLTARLAEAQWDYPLSIGNKWEYWDAYPPPQMYAWTTTVVGDTLMPNARQYRILRADMGWGQEYQRISGQIVYAYRPFYSSEHILFDFSRGVGDTVCIVPGTWDSILTTVAFDYRTNVFGRVLRVKGFYERAFKSSMYVIRTVADSIGLLRLTYEPGEGGQAVGAIIKGVQYGHITDVKPYALGLPSQPVLRQNFPNPFNPSTTLQYSLPRTSHVTLKVLDVLGEEIQTLINEQREAGDHSVNWTPTHIGTGVYFYTLMAGGIVETKRMVFIK
jgi:hypothetical protein